MKKLLMLSILSIVLTGVSTVAISAQTMMNDAAAVEKTKTARQVRKEILGLPYYDVFDAIGYKLEGNTVTLEGFVVRPYTKSEAEAAVADVDGVQKVVNNIEVLPLSPSDDRIRVRIYRSISDQGGLYRYLLGTNPAIRIVVKNGNVRLEGYVSSEGDKTLAGIAAKEIFGVFNVENNLQSEKRIN